MRLEEFLSKYLKRLTNVRLLLYINDYAGYKEYRMGAQILGVKNSDVNNDALITLVDMLGDRPGFNEIITLALTLHRDYQIIIMVDLENSKLGDSAVIYLSTKHPEQSYFEIETAIGLKRYKVNFGGVEKINYGMNAYYDIVQVIQNVVASV